MHLVLLLAAQAAPAVVRPGDPLSSFDLRNLRRPNECRTGAPGEIVVCGDRSTGGSQRLEALPEGFEQEPLRAEMEVGGVNLSATMNQSQMPNGMSSQRIMLNLKLPF